MSEYPDMYCETLADGTDRTVAVMLNLVLKRSSIVTLIKLLLIEITLEISCYLGDGCDTEDFSLNRYTSFKRLCVLVFEHIHSFYLCFYRPYQKKNIPPK